MKAVLSDHSRAKVYHRAGCPHASRIINRNLMEIPASQAELFGYRWCRCCGTLKGSIRVLSASLEVVGARRNMSITYDTKTDTVYIRTEVGFWKTFWKEDVGLLLYHLNRFDNGKSTELLSHSEFHRQKDVRPTESLEKILNYIEEHDRAMKIIAEDYRKLPKKTKKQRKYYRQAEYRHRKAQVNRVFELLSMLGQEAALAL